MFTYKISVTARFVIATAAILFSIITKLAASQRATEGVPTVELRLVRSTELPIPTNGAYSLPLGCSAANLYFPLSVGDLGGLQGVVAVSRDGKRTTPLSLAPVSEALSEVRSPSLLRVFATDSDVYIFGRMDYGARQAKMKTPDGQEVQTTVVSGTKYFIAQYQSDGTFTRLIRLDLPYRPVWLGAFPTGGFLIVGEDRRTSPPGQRVAMLNSDGRMDRLLELGDDNAATRTRTSPSSSPFQPRVTSAIVSSGRDLLVLAKSSDSPVFLVSPGGEVRRIKIATPAGYTLVGMQAAGGRLIGLYSRLVNEKVGQLYAMYAFDPESGRPLARYLYPRNWGLALACTDSMEFSFLHSENRKLLLLTAAPEH